jgi:hypothetical protein
MSLSQAQRADLQFQAERSFLQIEAAISELDDRKRRALRLVHRMAPIAALLVTAGLVRWLVRRRHRHDQHRIVTRPSIRVLEWQTRPAQPALAMLIAAALRAWLLRRAELAHAMAAPARQLGPARLR